MTNVLILGSTGMLGSIMLKHLARDAKFNAIATSRLPPHTTGASGHKTLHLDAVDIKTVSAAMQASAPKWVINCIGAVKQLAAANQPVSAITLNALFPHQVADIASQYGANVLHFSTDCVFSGTRGMYAESDLPDATDLYGRSKLLGELTEPNCLTLRTSMIGPEIQNNHSLLEWYLSQTSDVKGYRRAIFSGLTTFELGKLAAMLIHQDTTLRGVYHVAAEPIDKFTLLSLIRNTYGMGANIVPDDVVAINRSLDGSRFQQATGYKPPSWPKMISDMRANDDRR